MHVFIMPTKNSIWTTLHFAGTMSVLFIQLQNCQFKLSTNRPVAVASSTFNCKSQEKEFLVTNLLSSHICSLSYNFMLMRAEWIRVCYWCQPAEWWMTLMQVQIQVIRSLCYYWFLNLLQSGCDYPHDDVKWSHYKPNVAQRVGRGIALLFHYHGTRRGWVVSSMPRPHFTPRERPGTHFTGGWVGPRAGLGGWKISSPPGFDPGPCSL
jgi:hypothetical protein